MSAEVFDLLSVGGGSGGLACAQRAAEYGAKAAVIESHRLGGTCVNVGCVPKKVMWNASGIALSLADAGDYGFDVQTGGNDWGVLKHKRDAYVARLNGIYARNLAAQGVAHVHGRARFVDAHTVEVGGRRMTAPHIVIATGGVAIVPDLPGAALGITSDGFFALERRPRRVAVVGSGYIACELAGAFRELGSEVELFIRKDHLLTHFDVMLGRSLMREMRVQGITLHEHVVPAAVKAESSSKTLVAADGRESPNDDDSAPGRYEDAEYQQRGGDRSGGLQCRQGGLAEQRDDQMARGIGSDATKPIPEDSAHEQHRIGARSEPDERHRQRAPHRRRKRHCRDTCPIGPGKPSRE